MILGSFEFIFNNKTCTGIFKMSTPISDLPYTPELSAPANSTQLPQRDVPRETIQHALDSEIRPNYIPEQQTKYIEHQPVAQAPSPLISMQLIDLVRIPVIISLLYFVFQMHVVENMLQQVLPMVFKADGSMTSVGTAIKSALFGGAYFAITQISEHVALV
jgi:hypothetical protein